MKLKKLYMAFDAYANHDIETARSLYRSHLIETARSINAEMDKQLNEEFDLDQDEDFKNEVSVPEEDFPEDDFADSDEFGSEEDEEVTPTEWQEMQDKLDELEAMFKELSGGAVEDSELDVDSFGDEDQDEILFGDEEDEDGLKESFSLKPAKVPDMTKETNVDNTKSPIASTAKSPVGVNAQDGWTKDGTVKGSNVKLDTSSAETPDVKDFNNVQSSGKGIYKTAKNTAKTKEDADVNTKSTIKPR